MYTATTASFPPVDDLINTLSQIEYKKHIRNFANACIVVAAFVAAVVSILSTKVAQWYQNGGKTRLQKAYAQVKDFCHICYLWIRCEGYPELVKFADDVKKTYQAWSDLVTV